MQLIQDLKWRYAVKQFSEQEVAQEKLAQLLEATRLSASSYGLQPYKIVVIKSKVLRNQLFPFAYGQNKVTDSSHLIIFAAQTNIGDQTVSRFIERHSEVTGASLSQLVPFSDHMKAVLVAKSDMQKQEWAHQQAYIALGNFLTCAANLKIDSCPMTGFDAKGFDEVLGFADKGLTSTVICPIGYRHLNDQQALVPKVRFDFDDVILEI